MVRRTVMPPPAAAVESLAWRLKAQAYGVGFDLAGTVRLGKSPTFARFQAWLDAGHAGDMGYMARGAPGRADPRAHLPAARSALVVALNYGGTQPTGAFARYARGDDYHDVMLDKLRTLERWLRDEAGNDIWVRSYVDTGPFLERDLARQAGLGWFGKNTTLIHPALGSFTLLGALFTSLNLEPDAPFEADRCGTCTRCLDACPTDAFVRPHELDARRCISYLSIELRGAIPRELRAAMGTLVFGCDICQDVCPWNVKFSRPGTDAALSARDENRDPDLAELLLLSEERFRERFRRSPVRRAKRAGLARNAAIALGNRRDARDVPALAHALANDADPVVRGHVAWALGSFEQHGNIEARAALQAALDREENLAVRREIELALA
ncbi:MAG: tRNA epoxyqueuosine(34) reductase QueG [Gemmatimonadaceae bacterium]